MFTSLRLQNFKNFKDATLKLGPLTTLVGMNASGKSNIRDAFRFLHGIGRGYSLSDIIGERYAESGELVWNGIRGGLNELAFLGHKGVQIELMTRGVRGRPNPKEYDVFEYRYVIVAALDDHQNGPNIEYEALDRNGVEVFSMSGGMPETVPMLTRTRWDSSFASIVQADSSAIVNSLDTGAMRFLDWNPSKMRKPSVTGQNVLGDEGENLSSVLHAICQDASLKSAVLEWIKQLTPLDMVDFDFSVGADGKILLMLVESDGSKTSALSASDGTLRFLAMIAALFGPRASRFYFIEELDNGIHPTRLGLLLNLIESRAKEANIQVVATTHAPQLLSYLSDEAKENASLVYRKEGERDAHIIPILDIPHARDVTKERSLGRLHESGWLENAVAFMDEGVAAQ